MSDEQVSRRRRSIRLRAFDYRTSGLYVVTICTQHRLHLFGEIVDDEMRSSSAGLMVQQTWDEIPWAYPGVEIDAFIIMPNHIHGIVYLLPTEQDLYPTSPEQDPNPVGAPPRGRPLPPQNPAVIGKTGHERPSTKIVSNFPPVFGHQGRPRGGAPTEPGPPSEGGVVQPKGRLSLFEVMERYKSLTTRRYGEGVRNGGWPPYPGKLWQRDYYERIVRNERELDKFRRYIEGNPGRWFEDPYRE